MKITKENISLVAYRLRNAIENKQIKSQIFYQQSRRRNSLRQQLGVDRDHTYGIYEIENSNQSNFYCQAIDLELDFKVTSSSKCTNRTFIRVRTPYSDSGYKAFLIEEGDEITFNQNRITVRAWHPTKNEKCLHIIKY